MTEFAEVETAELTGAALDWAVAQVEGVRYDPHYLSCSGYRDGADVWSNWFVSNFQPSASWADGGRLIEKYQIDLTFERKGTIYAYPCNDDGLPDTSRQFDEYGSFGPTYLVAACRAIVAHKLGDTVSVPKELLP